MKIIYYYQTFCGLSKILNDEKNNVTHIHLSSLHFDDHDIHLNDNSPYDPIFNSLWKELEIADSKNIKIVLMIGGAGGAFQELFADYETKYKMLYKLLKAKPILKGVDLDIEEITDINNIVKLIKRLRLDFGDDFLISMAPIQSSMETDNEGMGGFIYKNLWNSCGKDIDYFNVQCYYDYSVDTYDKIIQNGYPANKINMGMMSYQFNKNTPLVINTLQKKYRDFGGIYDWEYNDAVDNWNHKILQFNFF